MKGEPAMDSSAQGSPFDRFLCSSSGGKCSKIDPMNLNITLMIHVVNMCCLMWQLLPPVFAWTRYNF